MSTKRGRKRKLKAVARPRNMIANYGLIDRLVLGEPIQSHLANTNCDVNFVDQHGYPAPLCAIPGSGDGWGKADTPLRGRNLAALRQGGADMWATDADGLSALHWAVQGQHKYCAKAMLDCVPDNPSREQLERTVDLRTNAGGDTALVVAIDTTWAKGVDMLLAKGASKSTVVFVQSEANMMDSEMPALHYVMVRYHCAVVNGEEKSVRKSSKDCVIAALKFCSLTDFFLREVKSGDSLLHCVAQYTGASGIIGTLLSRVHATASDFEARFPGLPVPSLFETRNSSDDTPLMTAIHFANLSAVKTFLKAGAPLNLDVCLKIVEGAFFDRLTAQRRRLLGARLPKFSKENLNSRMRSIEKVLHEFHASTAPERRKFSLSNFASASPMSGGSGDDGGAAGDSSDSERDESVNGGDVGGVIIKEEPMADATPIEIEDSEPPPAPKAEPIREGAKRRSRRQRKIVTRSSSGGKGADGGSRGPPKKKRRRTLDPKLYVPVEFGDIPGREYIRAPTPYSDEVGDMIQRLARRRLAGKTVGEEACPDVLAINPPPPPPPTFGLPSSSHGASSSSSSGSHSSSASSIAAYRQKHRMFNNNSSLFARRIVRMLRDEKPPPVRIMRILDPSHHVRQVVPRGVEVYGLFALRDIAPEVPVCEYAGVVKTREMLGDELSMPHFDTFRSFNLSTSHNQLHPEHTLVIDASVKCNEASFVNDPTRVIPPSEINSLVSQVADAAPAGGRAARALSPCSGGAQTPSPGESSTASSPSSSSLPPRLEREDAATRSPSAVPTSSQPTPTSSLPRGLALKTTPTSSSFYAPSTSSRSSSSAPSPTSSSSSSSIPSSHGEDRAAASTSSSSSPSSSSRDVLFELPKQPTEILTENCEFIEVLVSGEAHMILRTLRRIEQGEELLVSYGDEWWRVFHESSSAKWHQSVFKQNLRNQISRAHRTPTSI